MLTLHHSDPCLHLHSSFSLRALLPSQKDPCDYIGLTWITQATHISESLIPSANLSPCKEHISRLWKLECGSLWQPLLGINNERHSSGKCMKPLMNIYLCLDFHCFILIIICCCYLLNIYYALGILILVPYKNTLKYSPYLTNVGNNVWRD